MRRLARSLLPCLLPLLLARCGDGGPGPRAGSADLVRITTTSIPAAATGRPYAATLAAEGPHPPFLWRVVGGRLPTGLALDTVTGAIEGWPRVPGHHAFEVEARDGEDRDVARDLTFASARAAFALDVARGPLAILPAPVPKAQFRARYVHRVEAVGGTPPCRFALADGSLPAGLFLGADGTIVGTVEGDAGLHAAVVRATDAVGGTAQGPLDVVVVVLPLGVAAGDLGDAAMGSPYDRGAVLAPRGAGPPYAWRVLPSEASLPPGLLLDPVAGRVAGTPTASGTFPFRLEVTDDAGQTAGADVTIRVNPGPVLERLTPDARRRDGRPVVLTGQAFQPGMTVAFGDTIPLPTSWQDPTRATLVVPATLDLVGLVDVRVANPDGGRYDLPRAFRFPYRTVAFEDGGVHGSPLSSSRGIAAGDTDGDGLDDVVHVGSVGIEVLRPVGPSSSGGGWSGEWRVVTVRTGGSYNDVGLADLDADGDLDLVTLRSGTSETIETYRNDGAGGFPPTASWSESYRKPSTHYPFALALGDVDGDDVPDVAFTSGSGNQSFLWVYRGLGDGSFAPLHEAAGTVFDEHAGCFAPNAVALADVDGDGRDDVVVTDAFPTACAPGEACPTTDGFTDPRPGRDDVVAWVAISGPTGAPGPWRSVRLTGVQGRLDGDNLAVVLGDSEGDGDLDLAVAGGLRDQRGAGIAFLTNDGRGVFAERFVRATSYNRRFATSLDADLDGLDDLWVVGGDGRRGAQGAFGYSVAELWLGDAGDPLLAWSTGSEAKEGIPGSNPGRVARGDFDGDGRPDVAVDQSFHAKERFANDQGDGPVEGVRIFLNRSH